MTEKHTCKQTEPLLYLTDDELDAHDSALLSAHLRTCDTCAEKREKFLAVRRISLQLNGKITEYPDFTASAVIRTNPRVSGPATTQPGPHNTIMARALSIIRYALSTAAVFLLLVFIWEHTTSVYKISMLEKQLQSSANLPLPAITDRISTVRAAFSDEQWNELASSITQNRSYLDTKNLRLLRMVMDERIRMGITSERALTRFLRTTPDTRRTIMTFKNR